MKKIKIVILVIFVIVVFLVFNAIRTYNFMQSYGMNLKDMKSQFRPVFPDYEDDNFPEFAKKFVCSNSNKCTIFLNESKLYDSKAQDELYEEVKTFKSDNFNDFKSELVPSVLNLMREEKTNNYGYDNV